MRVSCAVLCALAVVLVAGLGAGQEAKPAKVVLVIHGGAGVEPRAEMPREREKQYHADMERALRNGLAALQKPGGTSLDAVVAAIKVMEDSPNFNSGKGAVFNREGRVELNASIMEGHGKRGGAVAGVDRIKNPIAAARLVMEKSEHVLLIGPGAELFARTHGLAEVSPLYFWTERRWKELLDHRARERKAKESARGVTEERTHFGTVGAVALDRAGNLAAGTSTGGIAYKLPGRVGDTPILGAATYAENASCAVSCTGIGEIFIRYAVAHDMAARMKYKKLSLRAAADEVFRDLPKGPRPKDGIGGLIALDRQGNFVTPYNTNGMYRGWITADGKVHTAIYAK